MRIIFARSPLASCISSLNRLPSLRGKWILPVFLLAIAFSQVEAKAESVKQGNTEKTTPQETKKSTVANWKNPRLVYTLDILTDAEKGDNTYREVARSNYFGKPYPLAISPDGKKLASGGINTIRLWDLQTGKEIGEPLFSAQGIKPLGIISISFSPDTKLVNIISSGNEIVESSNSSNVEPTVNSSSQRSNSISGIGGVDNWFRQDQVGVGISFNSQSRSSRKMSFSEPIEQVWDLSTLTKISSLPVNSEKLSYSYILSSIDKSAIEGLSKEIQ